MKFAQIIEMRTSRWEEIAKLDEEWATLTEGQRPRIVEFVGADRDRPNTYIAVAQFESYEEAMENSDLAVTDEFARNIQALCDEPITYRNLDIIEEKP